MIQGQRLNLKWTVGDVDRVARRMVSGMSAEQICAELIDTELESTLEEIEGLCAEIRTPSFSYYPEFARS